MFANPLRRRRFFEVLGATGAPFPGLWGNRGWGFGVCVVTRRDGPAATPGQYGWNGGFGSSWSVDPAEDMFGLIMTQRPSPHRSPPMSSSTSGPRPTTQSTIRIGLLDG